uniref:Protein AAR2 homolog n=1 Tax=Clytia hemisphaerica TaxID=252671 RepID=A0A7M5X7X9_9CNID
MHEQEKDNCILALQNIPKGCELGIDYHSWYVGERFKGISNISPGFHFVFVRVTDKYGEMAPRSGFFVYMNPGEIISKSFKQDDEEFEPIQGNISIDEMKGLLAQMAPYPYKECQLWTQLTCHVSSPLLKRLQPASKKVCSYTEVALEKDKVTAGRLGRMLMKTDTRTIELESKDDDNRINFTKIPNPESMIGSDLTKNIMDSSVCLEALIKAIPEGEVGLLGEIQLAYVTFILGQVYDAFEHWKQLLSLIGGCMNALTKRSSFYEKFIDVIGLQLDEIPQDFFLEINPQKNVIFLIFQVRNFISISF